MTTESPPAPARASTTAADRVRDAIALALVVGGGTLVVVSHLRYGQLATHPIVVEKGSTAFAQFMRGYYIEMGGYAAAAAGVLVGIGSYVVHARRERRKTAEKR